MTFENLNPSDFKAALEADKNAVLLDVRTPAEVAENAIDGAINLDVMQPDFSLEVMDLDPQKNYFVYCRSGGRSTQACMIMLSSGIQGRIVNLEGGITAWDERK